MTLQEWERHHILTVLVKTDWNLDTTAHLLRISIAGLDRKIREHRLEPPEELSDKQERLTMNDRYMVTTGHLSRPSEAFLKLSEK